jgi:hypothetical protein
MNIASSLPSAVSVIAPAFIRSGETGVPASESRPGTGEPERSNSNSNRAGSERSSQSNSSAKSEASNAQALDSAQLEQLADLKARDREVRAHEVAHQAVGGQYAGAISYVYERGPDGAQYAVGGEVSIDTAPVEGDPQATIEKMRTVRAAALAPAEPSPQDRAVAAQAMQLMLQAQSELAVSLNDGDRSRQDKSAAGASVRISQDASNTYQSVSGFSEPDVVQDASKAFQATA